MTDVVHYHHQPIIWKLIFGFLCSWLNKILQYSLVSKFYFPVLHSAYATDMAEEEGLLK